MRSFRDFPDHGTITQFFSLVMEEDMSALYMSNDIHDASEHFTAQLCDATRPSTLVH